MCMATYSIRQIRALAAHPILRVAHKIGSFWTIPASQTAIVAGTQLGSPDARDRS